MMDRNAALKIVEDAGMDLNKAKKMNTKALVSKASKLAPKSRKKWAAPITEKFCVGVRVTTPEGVRKSYVLKYGSTGRDDMLRSTITLVPVEEMFAEDGTPKFRNVTNVETARTIARNVNLIPGCEELRPLRVGAVLGWND